MIRIRGFVVFLSLAAGAWGQSSAGSMTGIVSDPSGARLPDVPLKLINEETGVAAAVTTNSQGEYTFPLLNSGRYRLEAEAQGFNRFTRSGIVMELGRVVRLDVSLQLGQVAESVEVTGAAPLLESETSTVGQFIENKTIVDMPLNGRRVGQLLALMGHAVYITGDVIRPRVVVAGSRSDQQQWLLDGVNASNIALEVSQALFNPPVEAVQEIRVQQNAYSAEFGNSAAGVVSMSTRSGTNKFTGSLYEYFRNDKLDARNFFAANKAPLRWNVFGATVGGPVIRNKTFFFTHSEWQKQRIGVTRLWTVPTDAERRGDFSNTRTAAGALVQIFDPATTANNRRTQFPNNIIPASRIDPVAAKIVPLWPTANRPPSNAAGANNFVRNATNALNITTWTSKVDHIFSEKDRISVRYVLHDFPTFNTPAFDEPAADPNAQDVTRRAHSVLINETHSFGARVLNDFRFNWQPRFFHPVTPGLDQGWPTKLGLRGVSDRAFPRINAANYISMGPATAERNQNPIHDTHIVDAVSIYKGSHSLRLGGEIRLSRNEEDLNNLISGQLGFNVQPTSQPGVANTGNAIASMLVGFPNSGNVSDPDILDRRAKYFGLFLQDDWKITPNFTLNIGLRWETHTPRLDSRDRQNSFDRLKINPISNTPGVVTFAGRDGLGSQIYNGDYNNFMPRFGFAWKPFRGGRTVLRGGYGVFFGPPLPGSNNTSAGFETSGDFSTPDNGITAPFLLRDGFPDTSRPQLGPGFGAVAVGRPVRFAPAFIDQERRIGYMQQWNFVIQHELGWQTVAEISYLGTVGHKLPGPSSNLNQVPEALMGAGNAQIRRPFPQFGNVTTITPFWGNSSYHGMNAKIEKRFSDGLNFLLNYTFSKFIDDVTSNQELGLAGGGIQNIYNRRVEKALSGNDVRNRFVVSSVYELPWGKKRKWMSSGWRATALGGWNIGAILTLQDGSPSGIVTQNNTANAFSGAQRANVLRDPTLPKSERTLARWFDISAFAAPAPFTFGTGPRTMLTGPGLANIDISLIKNFAIGERFGFQFRAEAFNAFNRANFEDPGRALGSPQFGVIGATRDPRSVQLGLKLTF
ncbi:MAG: TonB-dependent receptor [Bryobacteraceae bacterium]|nr:TonB-dependent receptor [Bryobacteraceae bacterium]